jgi:hypothetical protein
MALLAKTPQQMSKLKCAIMFGLTSGIFRNALDPNQQEFIENISRTIAFLPGQRIIRPMSHPEKAAGLLNALTKGKFKDKKGTGWDWNRLDVTNPDKKVAKKGDEDTIMAYGEYMDKFEMFWKSYGEKIGKKLDDLPTLEKEEYPQDWNSIQRYQENMFEDQMQATQSMLF